MKIVFCDTETTSLRPDRRAWDIGLIARRPGHADVEHQWYIDGHDLDLGNADPFSLSIGRFYERHPHYRLDRESTGTDTESEYDALRLVEAITRGAHLVGAVPNFDADVLSARMRAHGICPSWHYHLIDVEALAVGYLNGKWTIGREALGPPWKSDSLSADLGITVSEEDRHTALGDAKWARAIYDAVMGNGT
jgi:hypothetical protein